MVLNQLTSSDKDEDDDNSKDLIEEASGKYSRAQKELSPTDKNLETWAMLKAIRSIFWEMI